MYQIEQVAPFVFNEEPIILHKIPHPVPSPLSLSCNLLLKRCFDLIVSLLLILLFLSWAGPLIALLIKLDSRGPVFFLQKRNKRNGRSFTCIKFRTMLPNGDAHKKPACFDDQRITGAGWILRRYHLDELPQLFNVLWGDMSLIGPRPYMISDNIRYGSIIDCYWMREQVKPGITGLAQSSGHFGFLADTGKMKQRLELDLLYIRTWSVKMDLKIMYRTIQAVFYRQ